MKLILGATAILTLAGAGLWIGTAPSPTALESHPPLDGPYVTHTEVAEAMGDIEAFHAFFEEPGLTAFLSPTDRIPAIESIEVLEGNWDAAGSVRRANLADGNFALERIVEIAPGLFRYQIWNISTLSGRGIDHIYGDIEMSETDEGVRLVWSYNVKPRFALARGAIETFVEEDFAPFMEEGLTEFMAAFEATQG